jgi:Rrf2 family iron-sulfur cluster assembly transcriptional regulator
MCQTHDLWFELGRQIALFLCGITLADVVMGRVIGRAVGVPRSQAEQNEAGGGAE